MRYELGQNNSISGKAVWLIFRRVMVVKMDINNYEYSTTVKRAASGLLLVYWAAMLQLI